MLSWTSASLHRGQPEPHPHRPWSPRLTSAHMRPSQDTDSRPSWPLPLDTQEAIPAEVWIGHLEGLRMGSSLPGKPHSQISWKQVLESGGPQSTSRRLGSCVVPPRKSARSSRGSRECVALTSKDPATDSWLFPETQV